MMYLEREQLVLKCGSPRNYRSGCREPYVQADTLESEMEVLYKRIALSDETLSQLRKQLEAEIKTKRIRLDAEHDSLTNKVATAEAETKKLMDAYYAGAIDITVLKTEQDRIGAQIRVTKARLEQDPTKNSMTGKRPSTWQ